MRARAILLILLALAACAPPAARTPTSAAAACPATARPGLDPQWCAGGEFRWPPADGFAAAPVLVVLPPGVLLDRFGAETGRFFSPKGAAYAARALPYTCTAQDYTVYRVVQPLPVWAGKAAAWFDQPGGATQFQLDAPARGLKQDRQIEPVMGKADRPC